MSYPTIGLEPAGDAAEGLWLLTLNRPEAMNAMNTQMFIDLRAAMRELAQRSDARVLILTGAGERAFSVGGDLKERNGMSDETWRAQHQLIEEAFLAVKDFALPVIAAATLGERAGAIGAAFVGAGD